MKGFSEDLVSGDCLLICMYVCLPFLFPFISIKVRKPACDIRRRCAGLEMRNERKIL